MATRKTAKKAEPSTSTVQTTIVEETPVKAVAAKAEKKEVKETAEVVKETEKEIVKETEKPAAKKAAAKKPAARKAPAKKAAAKKAVNTEVYVQFWGKEIYTKDVEENIKKIWTEELGKKEEELEDIKVYIKPEDDGVHYVINGDITGFIKL